MAENAQPRVGQTTESVSPATLIEAVGRGSRHALRQLYDLQSRRLYGIALRITRRPDKAADALKDAFVHVWQHAGQYSPELEPAGSWLAGIVRQRSIAIARKAGTPADPAAGIDRDALELLAAGGEGTRLGMCLAELEPQGRHALVLAYVEGLAYSEVATAVSLPLPELMTRVRSDIDALRKCLGS